MTIENEKKILGIRPFAWIVSIIMTVIIILIVCVMNGFNAAFLGWQLWSNFASGGGGPGEEINATMAHDFYLSWFWALLIPSLIMSLLPKTFRFTKQEYTVMFAMGSVAALIPSGFGLFCYITIHPATVYMGGTSLARMLVYQNPLLGPDVTNTAWQNGFFYGSSSVAWGAWMTPMLFVCSYFTLWYMSDLMVMTLFRRVWIDVEALPFPLSSGVVKIIDLATVSSATGESKASSLGLKNRWLWIGVGLGFITQCTMWLAPVVQMTIFQALQVFDLTPMTATFLPWVPFAIVTNSAIIAPQYLIPLGVLTSFVIFYFILWFIFPVVISAAGLTNPFPAGAGYGSPYWDLNYGNAGWNQWGHIVWGMNSVYFGAICACVLWPIVSMRKYYLEGLSALWKKVSPEVEAHEPFPYRVLILLWAVIFALWVIAAQAMTYFSPLVPIWYTVLIYICIWGIGWGWGWARLRGEYGGGGGYGDAEQHHFFFNIASRWWFWNNASPIKMFTGNLTDNNTKVLASVPYAYEWYQWKGENNASPYVMEAFKVASRTNTHSRYVWIASVIGILLGAFLGYAINLQFFYSFGALAKWGKTGFTSIGGTWMAGGYGASMWDAPYEWFPAPPEAGMWAFVAIGGIIVVALYAVRKRFPGLPLYPIAFAAAGFAPPTVFIPAVIALVIKYLTIRVGGVKLYEEKGLPLAVGIMLAYGLTLVVTYAIYIGSVW